MAEDEAREGFGRVLGQEVARVIPWGVLFIVLIVLFASFVVRPLGAQVARGLRGTLADPALKQDIKEAVEYASQHLVTGPLSRSLRAALVDPTLKQDVKATGDYLSSAIMQTMKHNLFVDPALKQDIKEGVEFWMTLAVDAFAVRLLNHAGLKQDIKEALEYASQQLATHNALLKRLGELEKHLQQLEHQNAELRKQQGGTARSQ